MHFVMDFFFASHRLNRLTADKIFTLNLNIFSSNVSPYALEKLDYTNFHLKSLNNVALCELSDADGDSN